MCSSEEKAQCCEGFTTISTPNATISEHATWRPCTLRDNTFGNHDAKLTSDIVTQSSHRQTHSMDVSQVELRRV